MIESPKKRESVVMLLAGIAFLLAALATLWKQPDIWSHWANVFHAHRRCVKGCFACNSAPFSAKWHAGIADLASFMMVGVLAIIGGICLDFANFVRKNER
jgi:hypothetical protein